MEVVEKPTSFWQKFTTILSMVKFQHSVFAMPYALAMVFFSTNGAPDIPKLLLIVLCMITARNAAMSFNRIVDWEFDKANPRTQNREIPSGKLSLKFCTLFCLVNIIFFILFSSFFNDLSLYLSPVALTLILGYSLTKRFIHITQIFLGIALGISPIAAWIALRGEFHPFPMTVGLAVALWVAGFDLIYSTLDYEYDKSRNLKNIVVKLGIKKALILSSFLHLLSILAFFASSFFFPVTWIYYVGLSVMAGFLVYEHTLVKPSDLSKVNMAFFSLNGYVSMIYLITSLLEVYL